MKKLSFRIIEPMAHKGTLLRLLKQLNPEIDLNEIEHNLTAMADMTHYMCFGLFDEGDLIGICSGWTTVRIYCGKQLELDNVIIDPLKRSNGLGDFFINAIKQWSIDHHYHAIGLNTYVENHKSHKFYFNQGYSIIGYHFENTLEV